MEHEIPLTGGRTTADVVRIGDTIRRPIKARAAFTHELLRHLEKQGFAGAPKFLGIDSTGREVLSFVSGFVPPELGHFSDAQLSSAALLLRQFHDATLNSPLKDGFEVVCHGDASPCNCVFVGGVPEAFIDFDDAHPGSRLQDLGYAAWLWIDIGNSDLSVESQGQRVAEFFTNYGLSAEEAVPAIIAAQIALARRTNVVGVREWSNSCRAWVERNRNELSAAIAAQKFAR
jgi:Ser/Thr protein kinase RdoA (MazF antagonist)